MKRSLQVLSLLLLITGLLFTAGQGQTKANNPGAVVQAQPAGASQVKSGEAIEKDEEALQQDEDAERYARRMAQEKSPKEPKEWGIPVHGMRGDERVSPVIFNFMNLPHDEVAKPNVEGNEGIDPLFELEPPQDFSMVKNLHMVKVAEATTPPEPTLPYIQTGFLGPNFSSAYPEEPVVAAGPLGLVAIDNDYFVTMSKTGGNRVQATVKTFFGSGESITCDPIAYYDAINGRFVAIVLGTNNTSTAHMYLAISQTNDATGSWYKYSFDWTKDGSVSTGNMGDFEKIGISLDKVVISAQQYNWAGSYQYQKLRVMDRATLYSGGTASYTDFVNFPGQVFATIPAKSFSRDSTVYIMATQNSGGNKLFYGTITGPSSNPVLTAGNTVSINTYGANAGLYHYYAQPSASNYSNRVYAGSSGTYTTYRANDGDERLCNAIYRNGMMHLVWHIGVVISPDTVDAIKYVELNTQTNPWTVVRDEVYSTAAMWYYYPCIAVDSAGTVFLGAGGSGKTTSDYAEFFVGGQRRGDAAMQTFTKTKPGKAIINQSMYRWGDYTGADMDESASGPGGSSAWMSGQYDSTTTIPGQWLTNLYFPYNQVKGTVLNDADGNAGTTGDRTPIAGWTVQAKQGSTVLSSSITDASGNYNLGYLEDGTYSVVVSYLNQKKVPLDVVPGSGGTAQSKVNTSTISVTVTMSASVGQTSTGNNFILTPNSITLNGRAFNDKNSDGIQEAGEGPLAGWTINLTGTSTTSTTTNSNGDYSIGGLMVGSYTLSDAVQAGYASTIPPTGNYSLSIADADSQLYNLNFGNMASSGMTWSGAGGDNLWSNPLNWNPNGTPSSSTPVLISSASTVNIDVPAQCADFTLTNAGATVTVLSGQSLGVTGDFVVNSGTFNTNEIFPAVTGAISLYGGTVGYLAASGSKDVAPLSYVNLTIGGAGTFSLLGTATVSGTLAVNNGTFNLNGQTISGGSSSTLSVGSGAILQTGGSVFTSFHTISLNPASTVAFTGGVENIPVLSYGNLSVAGSGSKTLLGNVTFNGLLSLAQQVTTGASTLSMGAGGSVSATTGYVYGKFSKPVMTAGTYTWELGTPAGSVPATLNISSLTGSGSITLTSVGISGATGFKGDQTKSIGHYYLVTLGPGLTGITAVPTFNYTLGEFNVLTGTGSDQSSLFLARWNGQSWVSYRTQSSVSPQAGAGTDGAVTLTSSVNSFSPWGIFWGTTDAPLANSGALTVRNWIGSGSGGIGTDFNTASNWSPAGVPNGQDSCVINCTADGTINLSDDATIGALNIFQNTAITAGALFLDVQSHTLTINGKQIAIARSGNTGTGIYLCVEAGGTWINNGDVYDSCSSTGSGLSPWHSQTNNTGSSFIFRGNTLNLNRGMFSYTGSNLPANFIFDGSGTQNVIDSASFTALFAAQNLIIGQTNSPNVVMLGDANFLGTTGNITLNGSSVFDLGAKSCNNSATGGTLTINGTAKLRMSGAVYPTGMSTWVFSGTDTTEYYGTSAVTMTVSTYGNLLISGTGTKTEGSGANIVKGNLLVSSGSTLATSTRAVHLSGSLVNNGTITGTTSMLRLIGAGAQSISGTGTTTIGSLTINKASGIASLGMNVSIAANLADTSGTLSLGSFTANRATAGGTLSVLAAGTLDIGGTNGLPTNFSTHTFNAASTESFSGTNQTLSTVAETFGILSLSGSGTKTTPAVATTVAGTFTTSGTVTATAGAALTFTGNATIGSGTTFNAGSYTHNIKAGFAVSGTFTPATSTMVYSGGSAQVVGPYTFNSLTLNNPAGASLGGNAVVGGTLTLTSGLLTVGANTLSLNGPAIAGTVANLVISSSSSLSYGGSSTGISLPAAVTVLNNLTENNTNGLTLGGNLAVNGTLTLTAGKVITGAQTLSLGSSGTVVRTAGYVNGNLLKVVGTGASALTYEIGDASKYAPVQVAFGNVSSAGNLTAKTVAGDHPNLGVSDINGAKSANRYWTMTNSGVAFDTCSATFNFDPADVDAGAVPADFMAGKYDGSAWSYPAVGTKTATSTQINGLTAFSDFAVGEVKKDTIMATASAYGTITPSGTVVLPIHSNPTFAIAPNAGCYIDSVLVDGVNQGVITSYSFTDVTANHTIAAYFTITKFTIVASAGPNGTITPAGDVVANYGSSPQFTLTPATGYHVDSLIVDDTLQTVAASYTFTNVIANHSIRVTFAINHYTITPSAGPNGLISPSEPMVVAHGDSLVFIFTPAANYHVDSLYIDGVSQGGRHITSLKKPSRAELLRQLTGAVYAETSYTFYNVDGDHSIHVTFAINTFTITATAAPHGTITPSGAVDVPIFGDKAFTVVPDTGYHIDSLLVDGANVGALAGYTFTNVIATHTIDAYFSINVYQITASAGTHGSIAPMEPVNVNYGGSQEYTFTPETGYHVDSIFIDGVGQDAAPNYTFSNVTANHTIHVTFTINIYTITATAALNGSITPSGAVSVAYDSSKSFTIAANPGYHIDSVVVDGENKGAVATYEFLNVTADHAIGAFFSIDQFTITATAGSNGSIDPSGAVTVNYGGSQSFTFTPATGYHIDSLFVDGGLVPGAAPSYEFTNVTANHTIRIVFAINIYTITASAGSNGSIDPSGEVSVNYNAGRNFAFTPATGYHVDSLFIDGVSQPVANSYEFTGVAANHTISVTFAINQFTITATAAAHGTITPSGPILVSYGSNKVFNVVADTGYHIDSVVVDGENKGAVTSYEFLNVTDKHAIDAYFSIDQFTIAATAGPNGAIDPSGAVMVNYGSSQNFTFTPATGYHVDSVIVDGVVKPIAGSYEFTNVTAPHAIHVAFAIDQFTVTGTAGPNGSIDPSSPVTVNYGGSQNFTFTPAAGYHVDSLFIDGVAQPAANSYEFTGVTANRTIHVAFAINMYTVTGTAAPHGTITPSGAVSVSHGGSQLFAIAADTGYHIDSVVVDGVNNGAVPATYEFLNVTEVHAINAYFSIDQFTITASAGTNGAISPSGAVTINYGSSQNFAFTPATGYHVDSVIVDGVVKPNSASYEFTNVTGNHTIHVAFTINNFVITATAAENGTITPSGTVGVSYGGNQLFAIAGNTGYHVDSVVVDGANLGVRSSYEFTNITDNHAINAYFSIDQFTITASAGTNGAISPSEPVTLNYGGSQNYTFTPAIGYHVDSVIVDGVVKPNTATYEFTNVTANHIIHVVFAIDQFTITATAASNGSITPSGAISVSYGGNQSFAIGANTGYHIDSVVVDGANLGVLTSYEFTNVTANHAINAYFSIDQFTITASAGANGTISPSGSVTVDYGSSQNFTLTPMTGYHVDSLIVDGVIISNAPSYGFTNVTANHTIHVAFAIDQFAIEALAGANGTIDPSGTVTVNYGDSRQFNFTPATGYHVDILIVDGVAQAAASSHTFTNVTATHTIRVTFAINSYTVTISAGANGGASPQGAQPINYGDSLVVTITPQTGYHVVDVLVDGGSVGAVTSYTLRNITTNHTISASFAIDVYDIIASAGAHGTIAPSGIVSVNYNLSQVFNFTPETGYHVDSLVVDGVLLPAATRYEFSHVTGAHSIYVSFAINAYTITASSGANGTVTPAGVTTINYGGSQEYAITPVTGYHIDSLFIDGVSIAVASSYTFSNDTTVHTISATFAINTYTITASSGANGTVTPAGVTTLNYGGSQEYAITPSTGYHIDSLFIDGVSTPVQAGYTFSTVTAGHTIRATFAINTYTITATSGANGTVTPAGVTTVNYGGSQAYSITPSTGYHIDSLYIDGVGTTVQASYTFSTVTASHSIRATFAINTYTITAASGPNGSVTPAGVTTINYGGRQEYAITPITGYHIDSLFIDGVITATAASYTFSNVTAIHTIRAVFKINSYTIIATSGPNGSIAPSGTITLNYGQSQGFTFTPSTGYHIDSVFIDGAFTGAASPQTIGSIAANHTISVKFAINVYTITVTEGANGSITPNGVVSVNYGSNKIFSIHGIPGYHVDGIIVDGAPVTTDTSYTFTGVIANHTIAVTFAINMYQITASVVGSNGTIAPTGVITLPYGTDTTFRIAPNTGYEVDTLYVDEVAMTDTIIGEVSYAFHALDANHTIRATFDVLPQYRVKYRTFKYDSLCVKTAMRRKNVAEECSFTVQNTTAAPITTINIYFGFPVSSVLESGPFTATGARKVWTFTGSLNPSQSFLLKVLVPNTSKQKISRMWFGPAKGTPNVVNQKSFFTKLLLQMPNSANVRDTVWSRPSVLLNGFTVGVIKRDSSDTYGWLVMHSRLDMYNSFYFSRKKHTDINDGFLLFANGDPFNREHKDLTPKRQNNKTFADLTALKFNLALSQLKIAPVGLGELIYAEQGNPFSNMLVRDIAAVGDSMMTLAKWSRWHDHPELYGKLDTALMHINAAFSGPIDTLTFHDSLRLAGTVRLVDVANVLTASGLSPTVIAPMAGTGYVGNIPRQAELYQNYPNPFNPTTTIRFQLPEDGMVTMTVYNILGQEVATLLHNEQLTSGTQEVEFDATRFASGVYFYRLNVQPIMEDDGTSTGRYFNSTRKMILVK